MNRKSYSSNKSRSSGEYPFLYVPSRAHTKEHIGGQNLVVLSLFNFYLVRGYAPRKRDSNKVSNRQLNW